MVDFKLQHLDYQISLNLIFFCIHLTYSNTKWKIVKQFITNELQLL